MEVINLRLFYSLLAGLSGNFRCRCRRPSARNERTDRYRYEPITGRHDLISQKIVPEAAYCFNGSTKARIGSRGC